VMGISDCQDIGKASAAHNACISMGWKDAGKLMRQDIWTCHGRGRAFHHGPSPAKRASEDGGGGSAGTPPPKVALADALTVDASPAFRDMRILDTPDRSVPDAACKVLSLSLGGSGGSTGASAIDFDPVFRKRSVRSLRLWTTL
jgi:hypothetical protein